MIDNRKEHAAESHREYFTVASLAKHWGCSTETVYSLLKRGKLKGFKPGKDWRITDTARIEYETCGGVPDLPGRKLPRMSSPVYRVT